MPEKKEKILIIEDEESMREVIKTRLEQEGYQVETASHGKGGLEKAKTSQPDLILLDLLLPKIGGLQVLEKLKEDASTNQIPVVIYSQLSDQDKIDKGMKLGAAGYFVKAESDLDGVIQSIKGYLKMGGIAGI